MVLNVGHFCKKIVAKNFQKSSTLEAGNYV